MKMKAILVAALWISFLGCFISSIHAQGSGNDTPVPGWVDKGRQFTYVSATVVRVTIDVSWQEWEPNTQNPTNKPTKFRRLKFVWTNTGTWEAGGHLDSLSFAGKTITGAGWFAATPLPAGVTMVAKAGTNHNPAAEPKELIFDDTEHNADLVINFTEPITEGGTLRGSLPVIFTIKKH